MGVHRPMREEASRSDRMMGASHSSVRPQGGHGLLRNQHEVHPQHAFNDAIPGRMPPLNEDQ